LNTPYKTGHFKIINLAYILHKIYIYVDDFSNGKSGVSQKESYDWIHWFIFKIQARK
jgi:hypothetical protein